MTWGASLAEARTGAVLDRLNGETARIMGLFLGAGAAAVEPSVLQPAETLLDLYGEDIRARAYTTVDTFGELMLRPDFTVPVVQHHMARGSEPARYAYCGPVWRRRSEAGSRAVEFLQAGFELFDGTDIAAADAEVFSLISQAVADTDLRVATGDIGLILAAIEGLGASPARRAALRRHVWRPARFHRLLERFGSGHDAWVAAKAARVATFRAQGVKALEAFTPVGLRSSEDVLSRLSRIADEANSPPLAASRTDLLGALLALQGTAAGIVPDLDAMARDMSALAPAVARFKARLAALEARDIDPASLAFEGAYGRTNMEYYDGFVFGFYAPDRPDLPVIATGGRYDTLTATLGNGGGIPAVGGIVRPEALIAAREGRA